ncbi:MAG TPA: hypothetical protein VES62_08190 [Thermoleophilaceae bacterium]|nr:hypothetical protein [Thermoleophilaceae bacterium]
MALALRAAPKQRLELALERRHRPLHAPPVIVCLELIPGLEQPPGDIEALLAELLLGGQALSEWAVKSRIRCDQQSWRFLGSKPR